MDAAALRIIASAAILVAAAAAGGPGHGQGLPRRHRQVHPAAHRDLGVPRRRGEALADLLQDEDVKEFYLGLRSGDEGIRSFADVKQYRRKKRWLS